MMASTLLATSSLHVGGWKWTGNFTALDLIAAGTNGALLARRPDCEPGELRAVAR